MTSKYKYIPFNPPIVARIKELEAALHTEHRTIRQAGEKLADTRCETLKSEAANNEAYWAVSRALTPDQHDRMEAIRVALINYGWEEVAMRAANTGEIPERCLDSRMAALNERLERLEAVANANANAKA